jgi:3-phenylpropionate/trans-cinnamate dioxygenase ferredoxin subunit
MAKRRICREHDVIEGGMRPYEVGGRRVLIANVGGTWYAVSDTCSHAEASLAFGRLDTEARTVSCPLHGAVFDLETGEGLEEPGVEPIETYRVTVEGGEVYAELYWLDP